MNTPPKLMSARLALLSERPYYAHVLLALRPESIPGLQTLAVTKSLRLLFDPACVEKWTVPQLRWVLEHECNHILRDHLLRVGGRNPQLWNLAGDAEINDDLQGADWPVQVVLPQTVNLPPGKSAEWYFDHWPQDQTPQHSCGSCSGNPHEAEGQEAGPAQDSPNLDVLRRKVAREIRSEASKGRGNVPAGLAVWADAQLSPPRIDWRVALRRYVRRALATQSGASDYTWTRPNRRSSALAPIILPGLHSPRPSVAVVWDTSGSMMGSPLALCASEILGIVKGLGARVRVLACDAEVGAAGEVFAPKDIQRLAVGGGGTDMRVGIEAAQKHRPGVIVVLTDGLTPWPESSSSIPVLAAILEGGPPPPPFIPHITLPSD